MPNGEGEVVVCSDLREYVTQIAMASRARDQARAIYLPRSREKLSKAIMVNTFDYVYSPLGEKLRQRFDDGIYAKAILHLRDRLRGTGWALHGVSRRKASSIIGSRPGDALAEILSCIARGELDEDGPAL